MLELFREEDFVCCQVVHLHQVVRLVLELDLLELNQVAVLLAFVLALELALILVAFLVAFRLLLEEVVLLPLLAELRMSLGL